MPPDIDFYRLIAENAIDPIFVTDAGDTIIYSNPAAEKVFGVSATELVGHSLDSTIRAGAANGGVIFRPDRFERLDRPDEERVASFIARDGTHVTMSCSSIGVQSDDGQELVLVFMHDISDRVAAESVIAESERRFRLIADTMPQLVWTMTADGKVNYINTRFREYTGLGPPNCAGFPVPLHPDDVQRSRVALEEATQHGGECRIEHRIRAADGSYRWYLTHGVPLKDEAGNILAWYGSSTDIDDMWRAADALDKRRETLRLATEAARLGLWEYYPQSDQLVWDETNRNIYGVPLDAKINRHTFLDRIHPADRARVDSVITRLLRSTGRIESEFRIIRMNDGVQRWVQVRGKATAGKAESAARFVGTTLDVTNSKRAEQRVREALQRDALTGLPNRALLLEYCEHLLAVARRTRSRGALLFIDLDRFKPINDKHGHEVGDQVLKQVAKRLLACTREEDILGRIGGDEFVVALPHREDINGPATAAGHIIESISAPYCIDHLRLRLSPSIGIALYPDHGMKLDMLIRCADSAMYEAKKSGPGCYRFYVPAMDRGFDRRLLIEARLRQALEQNELALYYQPVMDMQSRRPVGVEALLRLPVPDGMPLQPEEFLQIAEAAGMINRLGEWVAREACRQHRVWQDAGLPKISMAINIASQTFRQSAFIAGIARSVRDSDMDPSCLQIELKERAFQEDVHDAIDALEKIRLLGARITLDGFGIGDSSIGLLSSLPLDKLKIDRSFISRIDSDPRSRMITGSVLALGHSLNLQVIGQGIESERVFDYLLERGCDQAQGYYFSAPLSAPELEKWLRKTHAPGAPMH